MTPEERKAAAFVMASDGPWERRERKFGPWSDHGGSCWDWVLWEYRLKPQKIVRYVNCYRNHSYEDNIDVGAVLRSRSECDEQNGYERRIACVRVEFTEGQFDE